MPIRFAIDSADFRTAARFLSQLPQEELKAVGKTLDLELLDRLRESKTEPPRVPVDTGALQSTGYTDPAKIKGAAVEAVIRYGGIPGIGLGHRVDYAPYVHDPVRPVHFKRPGAGPRFVSTHLERKMPTMAQALSDAIQKAIDRLRVN